MTEATTQPDARAAFEQQITDAMGAYLRRCRGGGMPSKLSNSISAALSEMLRLDYLEMARATASHAMPEKPAYVLHSPYVAGMKPVRRRVAPAGVPSEVMAALDRMCTPLDKSVLSGATADADAHSMKLIRDYVLASPPAAMEAIYQLRPKEDADTPWTDSYREACEAQNPAFYEIRVVYKAAMPPSADVLVATLTRAREWINGAPHGDNSVR